MRLWWAVIFAGLVSSAAPAELPAPSKSSLDYYVGAGSDLRPARGEPLDAWETALLAELRTKSPSRAAAALASRFGLSANAMRELVMLWLYRQADLDRDQTSAAARQELHDRFLRLLTDTNHAPLVIEAAAAALMGEDEKCDITNELIPDGPNRVENVWRAARAARACGPAYVRFAQLAPDRALPALIEAGPADWLAAIDAVPLLAYLTSPAALARVDAASRDAAAVYLNHTYIAALLDAGMAERAIAAFERLSAASQSALFDGKVGEPAIVVDGLAMTLDDWNVSRDSRNTEVRLGIVAAYIVTGRKDRAERWLGRMPGLAAKRIQLACMLEGVATRDCSDGGRSATDLAGIALFDQYLHHPDADPYPIAEAFYSGSSMQADGGMLARLGCLVFTEETVRTICTTGRSNARRTATGMFVEASKAKWAAEIIAAARVPDYAADREAVAGGIAKSFGAGEDDDIAISPRRPAVEPSPPFVAEPIPAPLRGSGPALALRKDWAPLPGGYDPVRVARDGDRIAIISLSQNYDPTGEVSRGGYWIHLSSDGGRSWRAPLYTGLAERFPYVVVANPKMPLFDGDALTIAVEDRLLDTRTISYPPVALRSRRTATDLFVRIPIADLERDSDGDGLTDLAARHLLVAPPDGALAAVVVGRQAMSCTGEQASLRIVMQAVLEKIFSGGTGAVFEPVDREPGSVTMPPTNGINPNSADRPILIEGDAADYACLRPQRLMIVYGPDQIAQMRRLTPDFHAVSLGKIVFNRARDRGYLTWSSGWSGGTIQIKRNGASWTLTEISSWIT